MAILITGASGFIGSKLIERLLSERVEVVALSKNLKPAEFGLYQNLHWHTCDLLTDDIDINLFPKIDAVIHLAGATSGADIDENNYLQKNEQTTVRVCQALAPHCKLFIYASSQVVYGDARNLSVNEEFPLMPYNSAYACSKLNCENWLKWFQKSYGGTYIALRFCGFIDGGGIVDYLINSAIANKPIELFSDGLVSRDYIHSSKGIKAIVNAIQYKGEEDFIPINIGSGQIVTARELSEIICDELDSSSQIKITELPSPQGNFVFSIEKSKQLLSFDPGNLKDEVRRYAKARIK
jgi:UDP-glucose 4-epimerase